MDWMPKYDELHWPTIVALRELGGSASIDELHDKIADNLNLTDRVREQPREGAADARSELHYRMAWARTYLKKVGAVDNSERGVWTLTAKGRSMTEEEAAQVAREVRKMTREARQVRESEDSSKDDSAEIEERDWKEVLLDHLKELKPDAFERLCQRVLREKGFTKVEVTGRAGDGGIDGQGVLRVNLLSFQVIFQAKRWQGSVGASTVRDFRGAMVGRADKGLIMTTGRFTGDARREATRDGAPAIDLVDGEDFCELLKDLQLGVRVKMVAEVTPHLDDLQDI
ncbi:MAG: restriction endonuclease [Maricaulaceae bacterium]|nr:restriction endonuclease [Maricaulaceae bacterium]